MACSRWQASARKKRRPEAISEDLSQLLSTAKAPGGARDRPPWAAHVLAAGCAAQQPRGVWLEARRGPKSFGLGARAARLSCSLPAAVPPAARAFRRLATAAWQREAVRWVL